MTTQQRDMIKRAQQAYPGQRIELPGEKTSFEECFTVHNNKIHFWFNVGRNTHLITEKVKEIHEIAD